MQVSALPLVPGGVQADAGETHAVASATRAIADGGSPESNCRRYYAILTSWPGAGKYRDHRVGLLLMRCVRCARQPYACQVPALCKYGDVTEVAGRLSSLRSAYRLHFRIGEQRERDTSSSGPP